jgi:hypothetical protein
MDERKTNKRGQVAIFLLVGIVIAFMGVLLIIIIGFFSTHLDSALAIDTNIGQVNLKNISAQTIGKYNEMVVNNADWWGLAVIFGMILGLFGGAYFSRNQWPKIGLLIDIGAILMAFFVSLYLRAAYSSIVIAMSSAGEDFAITYLPNTNFFILNLPIFVAIIGTIMFILFHSGIPNKPDELNVVPSVVTG